MESNDAKNENTPSQSKLSEGLEGLVGKLEAEVKIWKDKNEEHTKQGNFSDMCGCIGVIVGLERAMEIIKEEAA